MDKIKSINAIIPINKTVSLSAVCVVSPVHKWISRMAVVASCVPTKNSMMIVATAKVTRMRRKYWRNRRDTAYAESWNTTSIRKVNRR